MNPPKADLLRLSRTNQEEIGRRGFGGPYERRSVSLPPRNHDAGQRQGADPERRAGSTI